MAAFSPSDGPSGGKGGGKGPGPLFPTRLLGFGVLLAWSALVASFEQGVDIASLSGPVLRLALGSGITAALCVAAAALTRASDRPGLTGTPRAVAACAACGVLFPLAVLLAVRTGLFAFDAAAIALKALCTAGLFLAWTRALSALPMRVSWVAFAGSFALAACLYLLATALGEAAVAACVLAFPALSLGLLLLSWRLLPGGEEADAAAEATTRWSVAWRPIILMAVFSFSQNLVGHYDGSNLLSYSLGRLVVGGCVLAALLASFDRFDPGAFMKATPALLVAALALCGVHGVDEGLLWERKLLASIASDTLTLCVWLELAAISYRFGVRAEWLFGPVYATAAAVSPLGASAGNALAGMAAAGRYVQVDLVLGLVATVAVLACTALLAGRALDGTWGIRGVRAKAPAAGPGPRGDGPSAAGGGAGAGAAGAGGLAAGGGAWAGRPQDPASDYLRDHVRRCALVARHFGLTHREEEVLSLMVDGRSFQEIEALLCIAHSTLRTHVQHVYEKLDAHSMDEVRDFVAGWRA